MTILTCVVSNSAEAPAWNVQTIDAAGGGKFTAMRMDSQGNAHAVYVNEDTHQLKYAFWDASLKTWFTMALDSPCAGFASLALDGQQRPHVAFLEYGTGRLKYARWDGDRWNIAPVHLKSRLLEYYTSIAIDANDRPLITFYEVFGSTTNEYALHLKHVRWTGEYWTSSTIDRVQGSGKFNSAASGPDGRVHVAYANVKDEDASLRYAVADEGGWKLTILQGGGSAYYTWAVALALDSRGTPHIAYTDVAKRQVRYASAIDNRWDFQIVDSLVQPGYPDRHGIAIDDQYQPYISYYDAGLGSLKVARLQGGRWLLETVDTDFAGFTSSIAVGKGEIVVLYHDGSTNSLKCARRALPTDPLTQTKPQTAPQQEQTRVTAPAEVLRSKEQP
jgi:hypothetical protein